MLASIPGQTMGVSAFTDYLIKALSVSRVNLSTAYMAGTLASALMIPYAGKLYDRHGARKTAAAAALMLGVFLLLLSGSGILTDQLGALLSVPLASVGFVIAALAFFGIRFFGQGVLTLVARGMVIKWFDRRRGIAVAVIGVATSFGFSYAPRPLHGLIDSFGWSQALLLLAGLLILGFLPFAALLYRDSPEHCGLKVEEGMKERPLKTSRIQDTGVSRTASQARRDIRFWIIIVLLFLWALFNTALTFHVISIFAQTGAAAAQALRIFFPIGVISFAVRFVCSWFSDRIDLKHFITLQAAAVALSGASLFRLEHPLGELFLIIGMGTAGGLFSMLNFITWPRLFGKKHLGAVSGLAMSFTVAGSAVGPWLFSLIFDVTGGYAAAGLASAIAAAVLLVLSLPVSFSPEQRPAGTHAGSKRPAAQHR